MNDARERFLGLLRASTQDGTLSRLTLGKHRGADVSLRQVIARPVVLKAGPRLSLVWRHATRDITKNFPPMEALALLEPLIGADFLDAHLLAPHQTAQLEVRADGTARLSLKALSTPGGAAGPAPAHDQPKAHLIPGNAPWLQTLGVTNPHGQPVAGMADKFHQIQKFSELMEHLLAEAFPEPAATPLRIADLGCGKGYLTFALAARSGRPVEVTGVERRPELVALCNQAARNHGLTNLYFVAGDIATATPAGLDVLVALHACDTATDEALLQGIAAGARLLVVAPCCQHELRRQLTAPPVLAGALRHGIFQERQTEFVTDALRAELLEWAGYRTKVFEFVSTGHTPKNLMIAAIRARPPGDELAAQRVRDLARFYGIRTHRLATGLGLALGG